MDSFAAGVSVKIGLALTGAATGTVVAFGKYEAEIAKIEGLVGVSRKQLDAWRDDIYAIAKETGRTPTELAESLFFVTSAGLRGAVAIDVLRASAKAAAAGLGDQKSIADLATSAINAYGVENLTAQQSVDALTEAIRLGKLEPTSLAAAMSRALPVASALGVKFSEVAGLLAAMSRTGTNAEEGVTQLSAIMAAFIKPAAGADKQLAKFTGRGGQATLTMAGLRDTLAGPQGLWGVLRTLKTAFGEDVEAMAQVFPNIRSLRGLFDLLGPGIAENAKLLEEMADSAGITDEAFDASAKTLRHQWRRALATGQIALIEFGEVVAPTAEKIIGWVQSILEWVTKLPPSIKSLVGGILTLGPILLGAAAGAKALSFALGGFVPVAKVFKKSVALIGGIPKVMAAARSGMVATWLFHAVGLLQGVRNRPSSSLYRVSPSS